MEGWKEYMQSCAVTRLFLRYEMTGDRVIMGDLTSLHSGDLNRILSQKCRTKIVLKARYRK